MRDNYLLYARKSTESEDRQVSSIESQLDELMLLVNERKLKVLTTFTESKSAKKPGRQNFNKMIDLIDNRDDIKGIVCWKLNRLFRNPEDEGLIRQRMSDGRLLDIITPNKTYLEADSDFTMAIEGSQAQRFIRDLKEDTKRGIDKKLEMGWRPGLAPVGYKNDIEKRQGEKTLSPHPLYFELVRKIFELALTGKFSTVELYKKARQMKIKNSLGRPISRTQMFRVLKNPFYTGRFTYQGVVYQGKHKPMITDSEYEAIQKILSKNSSPKKSNHLSHINGLIKCTCGYQVCLERHYKKSGLMFDYYKCSKKGIACKQPMISADDLDQQVSKFLSGLTIKQSYVDFCTKWLREAEKQDRSVRQKQQETFKREYTSTIIKIDNLTDKWLSVENEDKSLLTDKEYKQLKQKYLIEKKSLYKKMKFSDKQLSEWTDTLVATFSFALGLKNKWDTGNYEDKRNILTVVGSKMILDNKKLSIVPRTPFKTMINTDVNSIFEANSGSEEFLRSFLGG